MVKQNREYLIIALVIIMALVSFGAGFLVREVMASAENRSNSSVNDDTFSVFWEAWDRVEKSFIGDVPGSRQMTYGAIRGALGTLNDPYTVFIEPVARDQEREALRGNFGGIGAYLQLDEQNRIVLSPIEGNPAAAAGVLEGDILVAVDGQTITEAMSVDDVVALIRGEVGSEVTITVIHLQTMEQVDIVIERAAILLPSVSYRLLEEYPSIGYIQLSRFSAESADEVRDAIIDLDGQGALSLILDLRHNGGGLLDAAVAVSDHFLDGGPILYQVSRNQEEETFLATEETVAADIPLVVLVNGATASSAEIVAGALKDRGRAPLIGTTTFGKGSVQLVYDLSDGSSVHVTSARWYTPNRHQLDQQGLEPDVFVETSADALTENRDEILEAAIYFLQNTEDN